MSEQPELSSEKKPETLFRRPGRHQRIAMWGILLMAIGFGLPVLYLILIARFPSEAGCVWPLPLLLIPLGFGEPNFSAEGVRSGGKWRLNPRFAGHCVYMLTCDHDR
jgi:hypothetical protein